MGLLAFRQISSGCKRLRWELGTVQPIFSVCPRPGVVKDKF